MNLLHRILGSFVSYLLVWTLGWSWVLDPDVHIVFTTKLKVSIRYKLCDLLAYFLSLKNILLFPEEEAAMLVFVCGQMVHVVLQIRQELACVTHEDQEKTSTPIMPVVLRQRFRRLLMTAFTNRALITVVAGDSRMYCTWMIIFEHFFIFKACLSLV